VSPAVIYVFAGIPRRLHLLDEIPAKLLHPQCREGRVWLPFVNIPELPAVPGQFAETASYGNIQLLHRPTPYYRQGD